MATVGSLVVNLEARTEKLESQLKQAQGYIKRLQGDIARMGGQTTSTERQIVQGFSRMAQSMGALQQGVVRSIQGFQTLFGVLAGFGALQLVRQATEFADSIADMAQQVDISIEALQRFRFAAEQTGGSAEVMDRALNVLNETLGAAATGSVEAQQKFANLGLRWQDLQRVGTEQAFLAIADALSKIPDVTERASKQAEIFGNRSRALANAMQEGRAGLVALAQQAEQTGAVLDTQTTQKLAAANDQIGKMAQQLQVVLARVIVQITPQITALSESFDRMAGAIADGEIGFRKLSNLESAIVTFFLNIDKAITQLSPHISSTITDINNLIAIFERLQTFGAGLPIIGGLFGRPAVTQVAELNREIGLTTRNLEYLSGLPVSASRNAEIERETANLQALQAQYDRLQRQVSTPTVGGGGVGAGARGRAGFRGTEALVQSLVGPPQTAPFTVPGAEKKGGAAARPEKTILDQLTQEAREAEGVFKTFEAAIQSIEREIRTLEPVTPIIKNLDAAVQEASGSFSSWNAAVQSIEQEIRGAVEETGNYTTAIERANEQIRNAVNASRDELAGFAESLNEQYKAPIERLREFIAQLKEMQGLLDRGVSAQALRDAQIEFARTTLLGQGLVTIADGITQAFDTAFQGIIQGTITVKEAFRSMAQSILLSISRILLQRGVETLLSVALAGIGGAAAGPAGAGAAGGAGGFQGGGYVGGSRGGRRDSQLIFADPGEFILRREAADVLGSQTLLRLNALGRYQTGGPVVPNVASTANVRTQAPQLVVNNIIVRSDEEAQRKRQELEGLEGQVINIVNRQILAGDGSLINRSLRMVHGR